MVRLVKGAYWDSEIKRAQERGLEGYPVFTRKAHTDVSYLACARSCSPRRDAVYPQFATHNAQTLSRSIHRRAGFYRGRLRVPAPARHGRAALRAVVGRGKLDRPVRVYAPVGAHKTCSPISCAGCWRTAPTPPSSTARGRAVPVDEIIADPVAPALAIGGSARRIRESALPRDLYGASGEFARARPLRRSRRSLTSRRPRGERRRQRVAAVIRRRGRPASRASRSPIPPIAPTSSAVALRAPDEIAARVRRRRARQPPGTRAGRRARRCLRRAADASRRRRRRSSRSCARGRQDLPTPSPRCARRSISALLRGRRAARSVAPDRGRPAQHDLSLHGRGVFACISPWNFPARDLHRPGRGGARGRQCGRRQARRADAADRRRGGAPAARGGRPDRSRCSFCPARARSAPRSSPTRASRASRSPARRRSRG